MGPSTRRCSIDALNHFERICKPKKMQSIKTQTVDEYVSLRRKERSLKKGDTVAAATVNKELRILKAILRIAFDWGYLSTVPKIRMLKEPKKLVRFITPDHFAVIYLACETARLPRLDTQHYSAADWWRGLLTMSYLTGWRIGEPLSLLRADLHLEKGTAITRADDNKGKRDELVPLHPVVVDHLKLLAGFTELIFPWPHNRRALWREFTRIQQNAGIHLPCHGDHEHTPACHSYGFHDCRRAFATPNAETLSADALQALMRHKSYTTTQRYINMASQLNRSVEGLYVPDVLRKNTGTA